MAPVHLTGPAFCQIKLKASYPRLRHSHKDTCFPEPPTPASIYSLLCGSSFPGLPAAPCPWRHLYPLSTEMLCLVQSLIIMKKWKPEEWYIFFSPFYSWRYWSLNINRWISQQRSEEMVDLMLKLRLTGAEVLALLTTPRYFQNTDDIHCCQWYVLSKNLYPL